MTTYRKTVLVTGAAGNVGSKLCQALLDSGFVVVGVDNFFSGYRSNLTPFEGHPGFHFHERSILEPGLTAKLAAAHGRFEAMLHMAAVVSVPWSMEHPEETMAVNLQATRALHEDARDLGVEAFVFAGSAAEYGLPLEGAAAEDQAGEPQSPYGLAKYLASQHIEDSGWGASLRFFNLYGPARGKPGPYDGVVRRFMAMALEGAPLTVFGDGLQTRDFVWVYDAVQAVLLAAGLDCQVKEASPAVTKPPSRPLDGVYNVGSGRGTTVLELARLLARLTGRELAVHHLPERAGDLRHSLSDPGRLERACGYKPGTPFEEGLARTLEWFSHNRAELV